MSFATEVECVHNDIFMVITISNVDTNTVLQFKDGNAIKLDQWSASNMPIYAILNGNKLEYGEVVLGNKQSRSIKYL